MYIMELSKIDFGRTTAIDLSGGACLCIGTQEGSRVKYFS